MPTLHLRSNSSLDDYQSNWALLSWRQVRLCRTKTCPSCSSATVFYIIFHLFKPKCKFCLLSNCMLRVMEGFDLVKHPPKTVGENRLHLNWSDLRKVTVFHSFSQTHFTASLTLSRNLWSLCIIWHKQQMYQMFYSAFQCLTFQTIRVKQKVNNALECGNAMQRLS